MASSQEKSVGLEEVVLEPRDRRPAVLKLLRSARRRLRISIFRCGDLRVVDEIAVAAGRGVRVQVLLTPRAKGWKKRLKEFHALIASTGAEVRRYAGPVRKYHAKYMVADEERALVTSMNLTRKCYLKTSDFLVRTKDREAIGGLAALFDADWDAPDGPLPPLPERLIVAPENARQRLKCLLESARSSIRVIDHKLTDPDMLALLDEQQRRGLEVTVLGRGAIPGLLSHGRVLLIDEAVAVIGSISLAPASLDARREVALLLRDPASIAPLNQYFLSAVGS